MFTQTRILSRIMLYRPWEHSSCPRWCVYVSFESSKKIIGIMCMYACMYIYICMYKYNYIKYQTERAYRGLKRRKKIKNIRNDRFLFGAPMTHASITRRLGGGFWPRLRWLKRTAAIISWTIYINILWICTYFLVRSAFPSVSACGFSAHNANRNTQHNNNIMRTTQCN